MLSVPSNQCTIPKETFINTCFNSAIFKVVYCSFTGLNLDLQGMFIREKIGVFEVNNKAYKIRFCFKQQWVSIQINSIVMIYY